MTDAQHLVQYAQRQFDEITSSLERHFDQVAGQLRESFSKTAIPPVPSRRLPPPTTYQLIERWVCRHKALSAAALAFLVSGSLGTIFYLQTNKSLRRKRRAHRSPSGARTDVVVVAGAVANPLTSALYLDLERRGFVVYVVANTAEDEHYIRSQSRADLHFLRLDPAEDGYTSQEQLLKFRGMLDHEHRAFDHAEPHRMRFRGVILVPDTNSTQTGGLRIEEITSEDWSDALNAKVLNTIATVQLLLPAVISFKANILLLSPSVTPALRLPLHSIESTVYGALQGFLSTLSAETRSDGVHVSHFKLGDIDVPAVTARQRRDGVPPPRLRATPLRQLHDAVFDQLVAKRPKRVVHVGRGSATYDVIGRIMPPSFIAWMMAPSVGQKKPFAAARDESEERLAGSVGSITWEKVDQGE
ncbi:Putative NAD(P)-binding domain superfamily [Septoria linicola]|uniref:NAD(P)-binding domain superfamily n=1 Tax=Septoria linicola TaxID=215465 RepID=A0A9Q9ATP0_9PEZI|nr:putative NAD(P)-binding domain superfamily [Septoria linicola]USW54534.1 Putative NAD(P)-binding domain superfamily [Septoria linicola]